MTSRSALRSEGGSPRWRDPDLAIVDTLLGPEAAGILDTAISDAGMRVRSARVLQVRYRPGRSITVGYRARIETADRKAEIRLLVAQAGGNLPRETTIVGDDVNRIAVWSIHNDPKLPGLSVVLDRERMQGLLGELGVREPITALRTRSYRPGSRAVVHISTERHRLYVKVVRPSQVSRLQGLHTRVAEHVRVPRSLGWSRELGFVVLEALPGPTLRQVLQDPAIGRPPDAAALLALLDRIPRAPDSPRDVEALSELAAKHALLIGTVVPDLAEAATAVADRVASIEAEQIVPVHGDFHSSQLIVGDTGLRGVVDIDTVGCGRRSDDLATLLAHLYTIALDGPHAPRFVAYGSELIRRFDRVVDPTRLRLDVAAAMLGFATGPFRVQQTDWPVATARRLAAAEEWARSAPEA
jgi:aminoglycoside phosphotransferase